ncbi:unnamed protein product, partial [Rotaria sp. Silwood1]
LSCNETLLCWIEILCDNNSEKTQALTILYSFLDIYLNSSNDIIIQHMEQLLVMFQKLIFSRLVSEYRIKPIENSTTDNKIIDQLEPSIFSLIMKYATHMLMNWNRKPNDLLNSILLGLCLMLEEETRFDFIIIQKMLITILPLLAEFIIQNINHDETNETYLYFYSWLLGKMSHFLINGSLKDPLEIKYDETFKSPLFSGGCEQMTIERSSNLLNICESNIAHYSQLNMIDYQQETTFDYEFLMSIYNNTGDGGRLIEKMKMYAKNKQCIIQKSIEQQANDASAGLFAVYIKYYRRVNLAKYELSRMDNEKPHGQLLSLFKYANRIETVFTRIQEEGGDCDALCNQIRNRTHFLLLSVKESHLIPIINMHQTNINDDDEIKLKEKNPAFRGNITNKRFRLLHHVLQASIRFKKLMFINRKVTEQKQNNENILSQAIDTYVYDDSSNNDKNCESDDLIQCMSRQYERAITRLIAYRFIQIFIQKLLQIDDKKNHIQIFLTIFLPFLRNKNIEWTYLENIPAINNQLKEYIGNNYYSIIRHCLTYFLELETIEKTTILRTIFYLLNLFNTSADIHNYDLIEKLFTYFVSFIKTSDRSISLEMKLIGYNWFRLYVLKSCENLEMNELKSMNNPNFDRSQELIFHKLIFNELKTLTQQLSIDISDTTMKNTIYTKNSLHNAAMEWFIMITTTNDLSYNFDSEIYIKQWLMLLLRCVHNYEHVRSFCATIDYIELLLYIYQNSKYSTTSLLALKIFRKIIIFFKEASNKTSKMGINKFFNDTLFSIGNHCRLQNTTNEIMTELIYIYRTIISCKSSWQIMALEIINNTMKLNFESSESIDMNQVNSILGSLHVFGGYIQPYCLGSVVEVNIDNEENNQTSLAVIIDINMDIKKVVASYFIQYIDTCKTKWISEDQLRIHIDVSPPNLLDLPNANEIIDSLFDRLMYFIEIDRSTIEPLLFLQLKQRSMATLYQLLINKEIVEIFIQKSYASMICKLAISGLSAKTHLEPMNLHVLNKKHFEQYYLYLDRCQHFKQIIDDTNMTDVENPLFITWNEISFKQDRLTSERQPNGWKSNAFKQDIELFKRGRIGNDEVKIIHMPLKTDDSYFLEECGTMHRFSGRVCLVSKNNANMLATFLIDNLQLNEGKWYYCVRLLHGNAIQIGWATTGFHPSKKNGIGNDKYSWSYDGFQKMLYNVEANPFRIEDISWKANDVCGCGIEIDGEDIRINYWLNGRFLGTAFQHNCAVGPKLCNMLPNGRRARFFPGVSLKVDHISTLSSCEFIFSPEDMFECPLPLGYKPLLVPNCIYLVPYPYSAYLISDNVQENIYKIRNDQSSIFLRDFINDQHLETKYKFKNHQLVLSHDSNGLPLTIDHQKSWAISFDFQFLAEFDNHDFILLTLDTLEKFSIRIPTNKIYDQIRIAIVYHSNKRQLKVYIDNEYQVFKCPVMTLFNIHILPQIFVGLANFAIWKYALSDKDIHCLFSSGLSYIVRDYRQLNDYRKKAQTLTFTHKQEYFVDNFLIPFNEPFDENKWEKKKTEIDNNECKFFKIIDGTNQSTLQLFGNKTYLVLNKSFDPWLQYTIILDIFVANLPSINEQLTLITWNSQTKIFLTYDRHLCLSIDNETNMKNKSILNLNTYVRLLISVEKKSMKIYVNGNLELEICANENQLTISDKHIDLFREDDLTKNTISEDQLRIACKSITYLNRAIIHIDERMKSSDYSLEYLTSLPYSIIAPSLINIGYDVSKIRYAMQHVCPRNIQLIDTILHENYEELVRIARKEQLKCQINILSKFDTSTDNERIKDLLQYFESDTNEKIVTLDEIMLDQSNEIQKSFGITAESLSDRKWFSEAMYRLNIDDKFTKWIRDKSTVSIERIDLTQYLIDFNQPIEDQPMMINLVHDNQKEIQQPIQYSHQKMSHQQYVDSRIVCEHGLISIYAHHIILNMLSVWSNNGSDLLSLKKIGDCKLIVQLLRLLDYHYNYIQIHTDENVDRMKSIVRSTVNIEMNILLKHHKTIHDEITNEIMKQKAPLLYYLQNDIIIQSIGLLMNRELLFESTVVDSQEPNIKFILKFMDLFVNLVTDKSTLKQNETNFLVPILFPPVLINLLFDLFLASPMHQLKISILRLFST